jgi:hypothetical protein
MPDLAKQEGDFVFSEKQWKNLWGAEENPGDRQHLKALIRSSDILSPLRSAR